MRDDQLDDELQFHIDEQTRLNIAKGMAPVEAEREARASLGSVAAIRDEVRDAHPWTWLTDLLADWKYGIRNLRSKPALAATAVLSLGAGIGVNATVYSFASATVFSEPSVREPGRLFEFAFEGSSHLSLPELEDLDRAAISGGVAGYSLREFVTTSQDGESRRVFAQVVTPSYFGVTGTPVAAGRGILPADENTAVISHRFWQTHFAGAADTVGRTVELNRDRYTIIGILPEDFVSTLGMSLVTDIMVPVSNHVMFGVHDRSSREFVGLARSKADGQTAIQLREALRAMGQQFAKMLPPKDRGSGAIRVFQGFSGWDRIRSRGFQTEQAFAAAVGILVTVVLLIACANVAGVLLANGLERRHEIAIRLSIGARRSRIVRQLLAETMLIATAGLAFGWLASRWLTLLSKRIGDVPGIPDEVRLMSPQFETGGLTIAYLGAILVLTTLVCGLLPAFQSARTDYSAALKGTAGLAVSGGRMRLRQILVGAQICASLALLALSVLFLHSSRIASAAGPGFEADRTVLARPFAQQADGIKVDALYMRKAEDAVAAIPGVVNSSWASLPPLAGEHYTNDLHPPESPDTFLGHMVNSVAPRYFATLDIPIVAGREFVESDGLSAVAPVVVSETFARRYLEDNALGRQLIEGSGKEQRRVQIVGVARDAKYLRLGETPVALLYRCMLQPPDVRRVATMIIRTTQPANQVTAAVQRALEPVDRRFAIKAEPTRERVIQSLLPYRAGAAILTALGIVGLLLAFGGLYGVISCSVSGRAHELGIRLALGATARHVLTLIGKDSVRILATGCVFGIVLALFASTALKDFLAADLNPRDPRYLVPVLALIALAGAIATLVPTLRVLRRDPLASLRHE